MLIRSISRKIYYNNLFERNFRLVYCKKIIGTLGVVCSLFTATLSQANDTSIGISAGSTGLGLEVSRALTPSIITRFSLSGYKFEIDIDEDDIEYSADLTFSNLAAIVDWHPWNNGIHLSTGLVNNGNRFEMRAAQADTYDIGDAVYVGTLNLQAEVKFRRVSPYVGFGWNNAATGKGGLAWSAELGVIFQGEPDVKLSANGTNIQEQGSTSTIDVTTNADFQDNLKAEETDLQDSLDNFKLYPVISFGLHYQF